MQSRGRGIIFKRVREFSSAAPHHQRPRSRNVRILALYHTQNKEWSGPLVGRYGEEHLQESH